MAECRADAAHGGEGDAESVQEGEPVKHHDRGPQEGEHDVEKEEAEHAVKDVGRVAVFSGGDGLNGTGVEVELQQGKDAFPEKDEADDFHPAGGGAAAAADKDQKEEEEAAEVWPPVKVSGDKAGGGGERCGVKEGLSQRWQEGGAALQDEGERHEGRGDGDDG